MIGSLLLSLNRVLSGKLEHNKVLKLIIVFNRFWNFHPSFLNFAQNMFISLSPLMLIIINVLSTEII